MNKLVLAGVSVLAINFLSSAAIAENKMKAMDAPAAATTESAKPAADCPPKKKHKRKHKKVHHKTKHDRPLWVNAEEPCAVPAPCAPVCPPPPCPPAPCEPTCPPAPCPPAPCEPTCPPPPCPPAPCAPVCK